MDTLSPPKAAPTLARLPARQRGEGGRAGGKEGGRGAVTRHTPGLRTTPRPQPDAARARVARSRVTWPGRRPGDWPPLARGSRGGAA